MVTTVALADSSSDSSQHSNTQLITGVATGVPLILVLVVVVVVIRKKEKSKPKEVELTSIKTEHVYTNPRHVLNSQTSLIESKDSTSLKANAQNGDYDSIATIPLQISESAELTNVEIFDEIGSGNFGCKYYINELIW